LVGLQKAIDHFRRARLILRRAQTNRIAPVQTDPGSIQPCAVLSDDAGEGSYSSGALPVETSPER